MVVNANMDCFSWLLGILWTLVIFQGWSILQCGRKHHQVRLCGKVLGEYIPLHEHERKELQVPLERDHELEHLPVLLPLDLLLTAIHPFPKFLFFPAEMMILKARLL